MYITIDDVEKDISFHYPIDNRTGDKKIGLIRAYFVYSFYNVENDEKIHLKNGETLKVNPISTGGGGVFSTPCPVNGSELHNGTS